MGFIEVLTVILIILKLLGLIKASWLLVLLPELMVIVCYVLLVSFFGLGVLSVFRSYIKK